MPQWQRARLATVLPSKRWGPCCPCRSAFSSPPRGRILRQSWHKTRLSENRVKFVAIVDVQKAVRCAGWLSMPEADFTAMLIGAILLRKPN